MTTSATPVPGFGSSGNVRAWDLKATDDGAELLEITHGITFADPVTDPDQRVKVSFEPTGNLAQTQNWVRVLMGSSTIQVIKAGNAGGSGSTDSHVRLWVEYLACPYQ